MTEDIPTPKPAPSRPVIAADARRQERLAAQLRANLARRKAQARARVGQDGSTNQEAEDGPEGNA